MLITMRVVDQATGDVIREHKLHGLRDSNLPFIVRSMIWAFNKGYGVAFNRRKDDK